MDDTPDSPVGVETTETNEDGAIVVTGSRIARRDLVSSSPVAVVADEEFTLSGSVNVEQVINTLPQVVPGATSFSNNPGGGVATLNLRGLGSQRNLVLVNGRRYIFFDTSQTVDINTIPAFLISSVDVVTGGASAVYGSDALAGVINSARRIERHRRGAQYQHNEVGRPAQQAYGRWAETRRQSGKVAVFENYANVAPHAGDASYRSRFRRRRAGVVPGDPPACRRAVRDA